MPGWFITHRLRSQIAGIDFRRWPLLKYLLPALAGMALMRTDMVAISIALFLLFIALLLLLLLNRRMAALLLAGALLGAADLVVDGISVQVDQSWLHGASVVTAEIEQVERHAGYLRYRLTHVIREDGASLSGRALLYHYGAHQPQLQSGQRVRARGHWREPHNYRNPGAFDYRAWCFDHRIALIGTLKGKIERLPSHISWLERQRQLVRHLIDANAESNAAGILHALLLGERGLIPERVYDQMAATGAAHLLAISGMHVGLAALWFFAIIWFLLTRSEATMVHLPVRTLAMGGALIGAAAYATMAGWPLPAVRATIMLAAAALAWQLRSRSEPINTLMAALGLILIFDVSAIASLSLWLSFLATAALLLWAGRPLHAGSLPLWRRGLSMLGLWARVTLLATLATLPLIADVFGRIPVYALPANLVMVPLYGLIALPAGLLAEISVVCGFDHLAMLWIQIAGFAVEAGSQLLTHIVNLPAGRLWAHEPSWLVQGFYVAGMLLAGVLLWRGQSLRAVLAATLVLVMWLGAVLHERTTQAPRWIVWDVGQGAASTLLLPDNGVIAVDAPGRAGSRFNGGTTVADGLHALGKLHLDVMVISHAQSDHLGGVASLMSEMNRVGEIWLPDVPSARSDRRVQSIVAQALMRDARVRWLARGDRVVVAGASVDILWPPRGFDPANRNNSSLVVRLQLANRVQLLWPGDIEREAEQSIRGVGAMPGTVMLMPHHGSRSSSSEAFVARIRPKLAIAQVGASNRYGFPADVVVARYRAQGALVRQTARGALLLEWPDGADSLRVEQWRLPGQKRRELVSAWLSSSALSGMMTFQRSAP